MLGIRVCEKRQGPVFRFSGCSIDCPTDITEADRGDFEIDTDPFPNILEDDGVPVYPWTKRLKVPHRIR